ncbi:MAG: phosphate signaling complex protein PhoU [Alphaproteobacteria bacterium]|nr:phosphate signaling complex protein PhoU [Alphaproteobacteria bacterium]
MDSPHKGHTVRSYDDELNQLDNYISEMGGIAESQLAAALDALAKRNSELAALVIVQDEAIDKIEAKIGEAAVELIARRQPMANDLRQVLASLKIAQILERIGDYAANVAKRSTVLNQLPPVEPARSVPRMGRLVEQMIHEVLDAYSTRNAEAALSVWHRDEGIDGLYDSVFRELLTYMMEDPRNITACTHLLFIAKNIERIGDYTTNVAEIIYFLVKGEPLTETRPKADTTSFAVMTPGAPKG